MFVDYVRTTLEVIDASTGEVRPAHLFVAELGASSYTYAEAGWTQGLADWIGSHPGLRLHRRGSDDGSIRQSALRHHQDLLLRAGGQPQVCGDGAHYNTLLLDREAADRGSRRRFKTRLRAARLRQSQAAIEDVDYSGCWSRSTFWCSTIGDPIVSHHRRDLMEIIEDRHGRAHPHHQPTARRLRDCGSSRLQSCADEEGLS